MGAEVVFFCVFEHWDSILWIPLAQLSQQYRILSETPTSTRFQILKWRVYWGSCKHETMSFIKYHVMLHLVVHTTITEVRRNPHATCGYFGGNGCPSHPIALPCKVHKLAHPAWIHRVWPGLIFDLKKKPWDHQFWDISEVRRISFMCIIYCMLALYTVQRYLLHNRKAVARLEGCRTVSSSWHFASLGVVPQRIVEHCQVINSFLLSCSS